MPAMLSRGEGKSIGRLALTEVGHLAILMAMEQTPLIAEIEDYCARAGITPSTLTVKVLGNSRFYERLQRKMGQVEEAAAKLRAYMAENPPAQTQAGTA